MQTNADPSPSKPVYDPRDRETINNPIPVLRYLQDHEPVFWSEAMRGWMVTRYDDAKVVLRNDNFSADRITPFYEAQPTEIKRTIEQLVRYLNTWVAFKDPPEHTRLKKLMRSVFTPETVLTQQACIERAVNSLINRVETRPQFDFISEFAFPLPAMVIFHMLGLPEADMDDLKDWSNRMQLFIGGATNSPQKYLIAEQGAVKMAEYFQKVVNQRKREPGTDLISQLLALRDLDQSLSDEEVIGTSMLFLFGGHETTTNLIGNGTRALLSNPDQLDLLRANPALIDSAIEEMLRYDGPTGASVRIVKVPHVMHGKQLKQGDRVFVMIHAANHDQRAFADPDKMDITRKPNLHLTFNFGTHFCMGAPLARLEARTAIREVIRRLPDLALCDSDDDYMDTIVMRGMRRMIVKRG